VLACRRMHGFLTVCTRPPCLAPCARCPRTSILPGLPLPSIFSATLGPQADHQPWTSLGPPLLCGYPRLDATVMPSNEPIWGEYQGLDMSQVYERQAQVQPIVRRI